MPFGIALSGGGVRGAAHIGVLKALEENGLYPSSLSGTSAGSIVAGLYAAGVSIKSLEALAMDISKNEHSLLDPDFMGIIKTIFQFIGHREIALSGFLKGNALEKLLFRESGGIHIRDVKKGIAIPAVDLNSGETIVFSDTIKNLSSNRNLKWKNNLLLSQAIRASCSFPSIFRPKKIGDMIFVDGGVTDNLPVDILMAKGEKNILAVDLTGAYRGMAKGNIIEVVFNSFAIMRINLTECFATGEKLTLRPKLPEGAGLLSFKEIPACIEKGYEAAIEAIPEIIKIFKP